MAPAELQALGCITFVHDFGGKCEVILNPAQRYADTADAICKIDAVLRAPQSYPDLVEAGLKSAARHTTGNFREEFFVVARRGPPAVTGPGPELFDAGAH